MPGVGMSRKLNVPFEEAVHKVREALKEQGFGILTEIDVKETLRKKLNVDYPNYKILGACNPQLAKRALDIDREVGTLLPCNVIVYDSEGGVNVSIQNPIEMIKMLDNSDLDKVALEAERRLQRVIALL